MYDPEKHDDPVLHSNPSWADPQHVPPEDLLATRYIWNEDGTHLVPMFVKFDESHKPLNPHVPYSDRPGRGSLGKWGVNHAVDPIVTYTSTADGIRRVLVVSRRDQDTPRAALPGGMVEVDPNTGRQERLTSVVTREVLEEAVKHDDGAAVSKLLTALNEARIVYAGYARDPRNTRNAWIETCAFHAHIDERVAMGLHLHESTDETTNARWMPVNETSLSGMYAGHAHYVRLACADYDRIHTDRRTLRLFAATLFAIYLAVFLYVIVRQGE